MKTTTNFTARKIYNRIIWMYWQNQSGKQRPAYLDLCLKTIRKHNPNFEIKIMDARSLKEIVPCHPLFDSLSVVHQADYARLKLLDRYGGIYLDFDTICMKSLDSWFAECEQDDADVCGVDWKPDGDILAISSFGPFKANTEFSQCCSTELDCKLESQKEQLKNGIDPFYWQEILRDLIQPILIKYIKAGKVKTHIKDGTETWGQFAGGKFGYPFHFGWKADPNQRRMHRKLLPSKINETEILILNNALYPESFKSLSEKEVLNGNFVISQLLRKALDIEPSSTFSPNQMIGHLNCLSLEVWENGVRQARLTARQIAQIMMGKS